MASPVNQFVLVEEVGTLEKKLLSVQDIIWAEPIDAGLNTRIHIRGQRSPIVEVNKLVGGDPVLVNLTNMEWIEEQGSGTRWTFGKTHEIDIDLTIAEATELQKEVKRDYVFDSTTPFQEVLDILERINRWPVNALYP